MKNEVDIESYWEYVRLLIPFSNSLGDEKSNLSFTQIYGNPSITIDPSNRLFNMNSLILNGTTDYLRYNHDEETEIGDGDFTIEFWFNASGFGSVTVGSYQGKRVLFSTNTVYDPSLGDTMQILLDGDEIQFITSNVTIEQAVVSQASLNKWHHIAVSRENNTLRYYVDGVVLQEVENVEFNITTRNFMIGGASTTSNASNVGHFKGRISNFRFTKGYARYNTDIPVPRERYEIGNTARAPTNFFPTIWLDPENGTTDSSVANNQLRIQNISQAPSLNIRFIDGRESYLFSDSNMSTFRDRKYRLGNNDFTIESWVNLPSTNGMFSLVGSYGWGRRNFTFGVFYGKVGAYWHRTRTQFEGIGASIRNRRQFGMVNNKPRPEDEPLFDFNDPDYKGNVFPNTWYHIAWSRKDGLNRIFLDGKVVASFNSIHDTWDSDCVTFGKRQSSVYARRLKIVSSGIGAVWRWVNHRFLHREKWKFFGYAADTMYSNLVCKYESNFKPKLVVAKDRIDAQSFLEQDSVNIEDVDANIVKKITSKTNGDNVFWFNDNSGFILQKPGSNNNGALISNINRRDDGSFSIDTNTARTFNLPNINRPIPISNVSGTGVLDSFDSENITYKEVTVNANTSKIDTGDRYFVRPKKIFEVGKSFLGMACLNMITDFGNQHRAIVPRNEWAKVRYNTISNNTIGADLSNGGTIKLPAGRYYFCMISTRSVNASSPEYAAARIRDLTNNEVISYSVGGLYNYYNTLVDRIEVYHDLFSDTEINIEYISTLTDSLYGLTSQGYQNYQQCTIYKVGI